MNKIINTLRLILRPITLDDAEAIFSWGSDPEVNKTVIYPLYKNIEDVKTWIKGIKESDNEFLITLKDGTPIGGCSCGFSKELNGFNLGCNFHQKYWHQGYGEKMFKYLLDVAKNEGCEFAHLEVRASNSSAINLYKKYNYSL